VQGLFSVARPGERIDAPTFGHSAGMLLKPTIVTKAIDAQEERYGKAYKIFFSPQGEKLTQDRLKSIAHKIEHTQHLMLLPARYEGMDARVEEHYADDIISIGDFVLMGGDLPAMVLLEGFLRLLPGVIGKKESVARESFSEAFVDHPEFTEPVLWNDKEVPEIIRSGNHAAIERWRREQAAKKTVQGHFSWLRSHAQRKEDRILAQKYIPSHYVALAHADVVVSSNQPAAENTESSEGTTSVTSIDIHDTARSSCTYGIKNVFLYTPLIDQQRIVQKLLNFWHGTQGYDYNRSRYDAVKSVRLVSSLDEVIAQIEAQENGQRPLIIATSAQHVSGVPTITYYDQAHVWSHKRPVLFLFGTGKGLSQRVLERCDYVLLPIEGFSDFNHLSVRSAIAIILDRWLGVNLTQVPD